MRIINWVALCVGLCALSLAPLGCDGDDDDGGGSGTTALEGTWTGTDSMGGDDWICNFSGYHFTWTSASGEWYTGIFTVNTGASPMEINLTVSDSSDFTTIGDVSLGVYSLSGGNLTITANEPGNTVRPTAIGSTFGRTWTLSWQTSIALDGTWAGTDSNSSASWTCTFSGNSFTWISVTGEWYTGTFTVNDSASPREIDLTVAASNDSGSIGETSLGVYSLSGDSLTITGNQPGDLSRPTAIGAAFGRTWTLTRQ